MSDYERMTALPIDEVFARAEQVFGARIELARTHAAPHEATYTGREGTVVLEAHRHGPYTSVVARTDQLRTSRLDNVVRHLLNALPYQPGDPGAG